MTKDEKCTKMRTHRSGNMPGGRSWSRRVGRGGGGLTQDRRKYKINI